MLSGNAVGIMLFSTMNKHLAQYLSVLSRLKLGASLQGIGVLALLVLGYLNIESVVLVMVALFVVVASIGFVGPNAMALAMAEQGARAGTASAIMGSMQFACGLLGGVLLNFMLWDALFNMALVMAIFVVIAFRSVLKLELPRVKQR